MSGLLDNGWVAGWMDGWGLRLGYEGGCLSGRTTIDGWNGGGLGARCTASVSMDG